MVTRLHYKECGSVSIDSVPIMKIWRGALPPGEAYAHARTDRVLFRVSQCRPSRVIRNTPPSGSKYDHLDLTE